MRRSLAGAVIALLVAIACAPTEAAAGCHRGVGLSPVISGPTLGNLQDVGALATPPERADASRPFGDRREGCTGPLCSSNNEPVSIPLSFVPIRLKAECTALAVAPPSPDPTASPAADEGCPPWSNPPLGDVFHPPRRPAHVG